MVGPGIVAGLDVAAELVDPPGPGLAEVMDVGADDGGLDWLPDPHPPSMATAASRSGALTIRLATTSLRRSVTEPRSQR